MSKVKQPEEKFLLRIDSELKARAKEAARQGDRSLNGHIINLIKQSLEQSTRTV